MLSQTTKRNRVLVVEDEPWVRLQMAEALQKAGIEVSEASNADEALEVVRKTPVDLVFTDIRMRGTMDGLALVKELRITHPSIKLAVGSAYSLEWPAVIVVDAFLGKPYDVDRTVRRLKALLAE
jgi:CheY-like chemotaxis protein